ncbi:uncharacterized protein N7484_005772 [Penicillium longicatenatum]|uniref:uncharacterized protein n=1 Tax=Penicillium longicatenatum TaxID=1561947 RepID=UPI0025491DCB|nr:uncharacterized protein N7484_005772 [Penicillium longicatenatum]KAJ5643265.1 hypothetical protein N7484_005772 [Penicillium longicatenatum]
MAISSVDPATQGSIGPGWSRSEDIEAADACTPGRKRKAYGPIPTPTQKNAATRQKITRACDSCKVKKTRCTGTLPCTRCTRLSLACEYNAAYSRGLPPAPLPGSPLTPGDKVRRVSDTGRLSSGSRSRGSTGILNLNSNSNSTANLLVDGRDVLSSSYRGTKLQRHAAVISSRNSPEPGSTDFEGNYLGPASGISFINRVWSRLHHDERTHIPDELQNESSRNTAVFMFGDKPYTYPENSDFALPPIERAMELVAIYFDFSMVTYRFLHRWNVEGWVKQIYEDNISISNLPVGNMVARTAIVLMIYAVSTLHQDPESAAVAEAHSKSEHWFTAAKYLSSLESGPPRLETIQVRLIQCLYLLSSSRANECWYSFGTALQVVTALGLHRKWPAKISKNGCSSLELELRKRIFWSVYTLDKYLSIMFGRPRLLHDEDIDQELPDEINDEDLLEEDPMQRTGATDSMMIASVLHYRLGRILGEISRQLYSINPLSRDSPLDTAVRLTSELERWKESVPPLFNSVQPTSLIPPLCRQSQVLQLAYSHAMIHATRSFLLSDFTDLSRRPRDSHSMVSTYVQKCIQAAEDTMTLIDSLAQRSVFIQSLWFTHYVGFCAILVVYIYIIQQHRQSTAPSASVGSPADTDRMQYLLSLAETCQQHLAEATRKNCPSRRYSIILEELRREVHRQMGSDDQSGSLAPTPVVSKPDLRSQILTGVSNGDDHPVQFDARSLDFASMPAMLQPPEIGINPVEDAGLLENLEGSYWWAQLDSWPGMSSQS